MTMRVKELFAFIKERYSITEKRAAGKKAPWTKDQILATYRFCCVHREDDAVTKWIGANWRKPHEGDIDLWFAMVIARLLNNPETLTELGYPITQKWDQVKFIKVLQARAKRGDRVFNPAYIVSTNGVAMDKVEYLAQRVLTPLWQGRKALRWGGLSHGNSLATWGAALQRHQGLAGFMAAQVVADMKYVPTWRQAVDWNTFATSGPGSRRGLNRVFEKDPGATWRESDWHTRLIDLRVAILPLVDKAGIPPLHAQDLQNCLCEFDKYERVRLGEGRPKQLYKGGQA